MKKFAFRTLSIILAAVLLAAAIPVGVFAKDEYCSNSSNGKHTFIVVGRDIIWIPHSHTSHLVEWKETTVCTGCGIVDSEVLYAGIEDHDFGDEVDPEVDMCGTCIFCGAFIEW